MIKATANFSVEVRTGPGGSVSVNVIQGAHHFSAGLPSLGVELRREGPFGGGPPWIVDPPNLIERLLGVSHCDKIGRAVRRAIEFCREKERQGQLAESAVRKFGR